MQNVIFKVTGTTLKIEVDLSQNFGRSKSGKSISVASSLGNVQVAEDTFMGLNVYKKG
jgi:hypothetical protein